MARPVGILGSINKSEVARAMLRHKAIVAGIVVIGLALAAGYTATLPVLYRSAASVLIENVSRNLYYPDDTSFTYSQDVTKAQRVLAQTRPVIATTEQISGEKLTTAGELPAGFETRVDGQLLYLQVVDESSPRAAKLANAWARAFVIEMTRRAQATGLLLIKELPELRKAWIEKVVALHTFQSETNFEPREFESHPVHKRNSEFNNKLIETRIKLADLETDEGVLKANASSPAAILQLPRAKTDLALQSWQKQIDDCRVKLRDVKEKYKSDSMEVKAAEQSIADAVAGQNEAAQSLIKQVSLALEKVRAEHETLQALCKQSEKDFEALKAKANQYQILEADAKNAQREYDQWDQKKGETAMTGKFSTAKQWEEAEVSSVPYKPNWRQNMLAGLLLSLLAAVAFAYLIERLDDTVRSGRDLERRLGVPPLGVIPVFEHTLADEDGYMLAQRQASSVVVDSLRNIHIGLEVTQGAHRTGQPLVITVTSAVPNEGKSFLTSNLATLFAGLGRRVLVVDADLRKGSLSRAFKCKARVGLREAVASGKWSPEYAINGTTPGFHLLPVGEESFSPDSLNPEGFERLLAQMKTGFDVILFDTPPVLAVADACVIGHCSDVLLLVTRSRMTRLPQVERAAASLFAANVKQVQFVVNGVDAADAASDAYGYGYGYDYGYGYGYGKGYGYGHRKGPGRKGGRDEEAEEPAEERPGDE